MLDLLMIFVESLARIFPNIFGQPHVDLHPGTTASLGEPLKVYFIFYKSTSQPSIKRLALCYQEGKQLAVTT